MVCKNGVASFRLTSSLARPVDLHGFIPTHFGSKNEIILPKSEIGMISSPSETSSAPAPSSHGGSVEIHRVREVQPGTYRSIPASSSLLTPPNSHKGKSQSQIINLQPRVSLSNVGTSGQYCDGNSYRGASVPAKKIKRPSETEVGKRNPHYPGSSYSRYYQEPEKRIIRTRNRDI